MTRTLTQRSGVASGRIRKYMLGVAMVVVGVGAALGISQLIHSNDVGTPSVQTEWLLEDELAAIRAGASRGAATRTAEDEMAAATAAAQQEAARDAPALRQSQEWSLEDELAAIQSGSTKRGPDTTESRSGPR